MSDYVSARVKQLRDATVLMKEKQRLEDVKHQECRFRQRLDRGKMLSRIGNSYSSSRYPDFYGHRLSTGVHQWLQQLIDFVTYFVPTVAFLINSIYIYTLHCVVGYYL